MRTRQRTLAALVIVATLLAMAPGGAADEAPAAVEARGAPLGSEFRINETLTPRMDSQPAAVWSEATDQYLVVWMDRRNPSTYTDIYGQLVSSAGAAVGANLQITGPAAIGHDSLPAVAWNETRGQYLVVWADGRNWNTRGNDIYGQRVSATGERLRGNFRISGDAATAEEAQPSVAWNADTNEYLVVWEDRRNVASGYGSDIYGQRVSAAGERLSGDFRISRAESGQFDAAVVWNSQVNEYLVVWSDQRNNPTRRLDIYGQRVSAAGTRLGGNFRISGTGALEDDTEPMVAYNADANQYLVVWEDRRLGGYSVSDIYGRRVSGDGKRLGADFRISGLTWSSGGLLPVVAWNAKAGEYLVVWSDRRNESASGYDIYGQEVRASGRLDGGNFRISGAGATAHEGAPGIAYSGPLNQYLVVWQDKRAGYDDWDIWGRRVSG